MGISKKFVVYELNRILGSDTHKALEEVRFDGIVYNMFDTEDDAIQALID